MALRNNVVCNDYITMGSLKRRFITKVLPTMKLASFPESCTSTPSVNSTTF